VCLLQCHHPGSSLWFPAPESGGSQQDASALKRLAGDPFPVEMAKVGSMSTGEFDRRTLKTVRSVSTPLALFVEAGASRQSGEFCVFSKFLFADAEIVRPHLLTVRMDCRLIAKA
jgi:hypothetical protein